MEFLYKVDSEYRNSPSISIRELAIRLETNEQKVLRCLIDLGHLRTKEQELQEQGFSIAEIAKKLGKSEGAVKARLPHSKGMYLTDNPSKNALRIRKCRAKNANKN